MLLSLVPMAQGAKSHGFSVSDDQLVVFAPGNLQYSSFEGSHLCADGSTQPGLWRFAPNQWDYTSHLDVFTGYIDLFSWGTSGWNSGAHYYTPDMHGESCYDFFVGGDEKNHLTGNYRYADWAVYNTIAGHAPNTWRTPTLNEYNYVLFNRENANQLLGLATINADRAVHGLVLLPDDYPLSDTSLPAFVSGRNTSYSTNTYSTSQWKQMENAGAVFLPAAGYVEHSIEYQENVMGLYWSSNSGTMQDFIVHCGAAGISFTNSSVGNVYAGRDMGYAVRPVRDIQPDLCIDGTLIFKDDFGGNDPSSPAVSSTRLKYFDEAFAISDGTYLSATQYLVAKKGFSNGGQWHQLDDHTYYGDYNRGYFLQVNGSGGRFPCYRKKIGGLCAGTKLSFTAYVANVTYANQIPNLQQKYGYIYPRFRFIIKDATTEQELAYHLTGDILPNEVWASGSADWQLIGMNFIVPEGVSSVELCIDSSPENTNRDGAVGNDFALDDIEVHLCMPPVSVEGTDSVCPFASTELTAISDYQQQTELPLEYRWWHSADSVTWTEIADADSSVLTLASLQYADSGWYKVAMAIEGNISSINCRTESEPFRLYIRPFKQCVPPVTIRSPHNVCEGRHYRFNVRFDNNGIVTEPVAYRWQYTATFDPDIPVDDNPWTALPAPNGEQAYPDFDNILEADSGWYRVIIANETYINDPENRAVSEPFHLRVSADCPICTDGRLLFVEPFDGGQPATYTRTMTDVCAGTELSVIANITDAPLPADARLTVTLTDSDTDEELKRYDADSTELTEWRRAGFNFGVPPGTSSLTLTITNPTEVTMADLEVYLCAPSVEIAAVDTVCRETEQLFTAQLHNGSNDRLAFAEPLDYQWLYSSDQTTWTPVSLTADSTWLIPATTDDDGGWYKVMVAEQGNVGSDNCRVESTPFLLNIRKCLNPPQTKDTTVCDTLMPYLWHDLLWQEVGDSVVMLHYTTGEDSVLMTYVFMNEHCCPDIRYADCRIAICDTLLPYTWHYLDTAVIFTSIHDEHLVPVAHEHWPGCTGTVYTLAIDTFHCERLWALLVNKYNWQLLVNHVALNRFFPERTPRTYQWYKDGALIDGANGDDYAELNELHGTFQLLVWFDDGTYAWSHVISIMDTPEPQPVSMRIFNSNGMPVSGDRLTRGIYIIRYQQGDRVWTQKKIVL